jgi:small conductance mechanosensitive channel
VRSEASKHRHALAQVITWVTLVAIYCATGVAIAARLGVPVSGLVAPAAVAGVALGFGDLVRLTVPGPPEAAMGTVEGVTLRVTTIRSVDGEVIITPNGQITQVVNLSRDWARAVMDVPVPVAVDVNHVSELLRQIGRSAYQEPDRRPLLLDPPSVMGVQSIDVDHFQVRLVARTLPGKQFDVARVLRARITAGLLREGIHLPMSPATQDTAVTV